MERQEREGGARPRNCGTHASHKAAGLALEAQKRAVKTNDGGQGPDIGRKVSGGPERETGEQSRVGISAAATIRKKK